MDEADIRHDPQFLPHGAPVPAEGVILSPPQPVLGAVVEQIDRWIESRAEDQFRVSFHEAMHRLLGDLQEPGWHQFGGDQSIFTDNGPPVRAVDQRPHIPFFIHLEPICPSRYVGIGLDQLQQASRFP